jgi:hypothetical protein
METNVHRQQMEGVFNITLSAGSVLRTAVDGEIIVCVGFSEDGRTASFARVALAPVIDLEIGGQQLLESFRRTYIGKEKGQTPAPKADDAAAATGLQLGDLRTANRLRSHEAFSETSDTSDTSDTSGRLTGLLAAFIVELGQLCNVIKKLQNGEVVSDRAIGNEIAGIVISLDLFAENLGIDLACAITARFNEVGRARGSRYFLPKRSLG